jgi:hypothetical protein
MSRADETRPIVGHPVAGWIEATRPVRITAESDPSPSLARHNILVSASDPRTARHIIRDWERIEASDRDVGFLVLFDEHRGTDQPEIPAGDDRAIARHALIGVLGGGIPGAILGAILLGAAAAIVVGHGAAVLGATLGGAALGGPFGAVLGFTATSGWSSAYRESFVRRRPGATYVATFHTDDKLAQQFARLRVQAHTSTGIQVVDAHHPDVIR